MKDPSDEYLVHEIHRSDEYLVREIHHYLFSLLGEFRKWSVRLMATLDDVLAALQAEASEISKVQTYIATLQEQARASSQDVTKLQQALDQANANVAALTAALPPTP